MRAYFQLLGLFALSLGLSVTLGAKERDCECDYKRTWLDIVFVLDSSKEMNAQDFYSVRNFAAAVAKQVNISQETGAYSRIGFINGGEKAEVVADLTTFKSSGEAADAIHKITYMNADNFNLRKSLLEASNMIERSNRQNVKKLVIVFSGKSEECIYQGKFQMKMVKPEEDQNPCRITAHIKENGGIVMTVGLKYDNADTFPHMKFGSECYRLNFDEQFAQNFLRKLCDANCFCNAPFVQFTDPADKCHKYGECIYQTGQAVNYEVATQTCNDIQTTMTEILSPEKDTFLKNMAIKYGMHSFWLGATGVDGHYKWINSGAAVESGPWAQGQPNVHDGNCAYEDVDSGKWSAAECENFIVTNYYTCQKISCDTNNYCNMTSIQH